MSTNQLNIIGVGGCGSNVTAHVTKLLKDSGLGCPVKSYRLYSSEDDNGHTFDVSHKFVSKGLVDDTELTGSGGDRKVNLPHYIVGVKEFLTSQQRSESISKAKDGKAVNVVIFSGSKGTGSTAGPILAKYLLEMGIPFFSVLVVDNEDELTIINCVNTIKTIEGIAIATKKNPLTYIAQNNVDAKTLTGVNDQISKVILSMALMGTGKVNDLDESDYNSFVDVTRYSSISFKPAPMILTSIPKDEYGNDTPIPNGLTPLVARVIKTSKDEKTTSIKKIKHAPQGWFIPVGTEDKSNLSIANTLPTTMISCLGVQHYVDNLEKTFKVIQSDVEYSRIKDDIKAMEGKVGDGYMDNTSTSSSSTQSDNLDDDDDIEWTTGFVL